MSKKQIMDNEIIATNYINDLLENNTPDYFSGNLSEEEKNKLLADIAKSNLQNLYTLIDINKNVSSILQYLFILNIIALVILITILIKFNII